MTEIQIMNRRKELQRQLSQKLSVMEKTDEIKQIRKEIKELQEQCPHINEKSEFSLIDGCCPFCGKKMED